MSLIPVITDYQQKKPKNSLVASLTQADIDYYERLLASIVAYPDHIQYFEKPKRLYQNNYFITIFNDITWFPKQKSKWETYIRKKFSRGFVDNDDPISNFNQWCHSHQIEIYDSELKELSFYDNPEFNLIFIRDKNGLNCYAKLYSYNNQVKFIANENDSKFFEKIVRYLRLERHLRSLHHIKKNQTIIDALTLELTRGFHIVQNRVKLVGNKVDTYCYLYYNPLVPNALNRKFPDWESFMGQFENKSDRSLFMAWIYSIFVEDDKNRQVLWIEGAGFSGKSSIVSVIGEILSEVNIDLYKVINPRDNDKFALAGIDKCRLIAFPDNQDSYLIRNPNIRNITGKDSMSIREMNTNPRPGFVFCKVFVASNHDYPPIIDYSKREDTTRLLHIKLNQQKIIENEAKWSSKRNRTSFDYRLKFQFSGFMRAARTEYAKCKQNTGLLKVNQ